MALEHALDLARIDVLPAAHEHVVGPSHEVVEPVLVAPHDVAGAVVAVFRHHAGGLGGQVMIALHEGRGPELELALVGAAVAVADEPRADVLDGVPERDVRAREAAGMPGAEGDRAGLGRAVAIGDERAREDALHRLDQRLRERRRAHAHALDRAEIAPGQQVGLPRHQGEHGGHAGEPGAAVARDGLDVGGARNCGSSTMLAWEARTVLAVPRAFM